LAAQFGYLPGTLWILIGAVLGGAVQDMVTLFFKGVLCNVLVCAVVLPSRLRSLTNAFGIERILRSHRWMGLLALNLVLFHLALVLADNPANVSLLDPVIAPPRARAATGATVGLVLLCLFAAIRRCARCSGRSRSRCWRC